MVKVIGANGNIQDVDQFLKQIVNLSKEHKIVIQALDANAVYGKDHLISALEHAKRAFERGRNSTNSLAMEILLYASGERQIQKSIQKLGVKKGRVNIAFVFDGKVSNEIVDNALETFNLSRDDKVLEGDKDTLKIFGITQRELMTISENNYGHLILEKVAMVDIIK